MRVIIQTFAEKFSPIQISYQEEETLAVSCVCVVWNANINADLQNL